MISETTTGVRLSPRSGDLRHLREEGLIDTTRVPGYRDHAVSPTKAVAVSSHYHRGHMVRQRGALRLFR